LRGEGTCEKKVVVVARTHVCFICRSLLRVRGHIEGVAAHHFQKEKALKAIAKYSRLRDPKKVQQIYQDSMTYLEKVPRVEPEAILSILEFMGKRDVALEKIADNSIVDRLVREAFVDKLYKTP